MAGGSKVAIYAAVAANGLIAISKFFVAAFTGSSAMLAEGIHSVIDTGNGLLLLLGLKKAKKTPDSAHTFGYGKEIYFWSFVVSILIFALGGGFAIYEGIHALQEPTVISDPFWNYIVLAGAIIFETVALILALKSFRKSSIRGNIIRRIVKSKDPANFAIIIEDTAAVTGLCIALAGVFISQHFQNPYADGIASILIGVLLLTVSTFLASETKGLLLGESARPLIIEQLKELMMADQRITSFDEPKSMHFGPNEILLVLEVKIDKTLVREEVDKTVKDLRSKAAAILPSQSTTYVQVVED